MSYQEDLKQHADLVQARDAAQADYDKLQKESQSAPAEEARALQPELDSAEKRLEVASTELSKFEQTHPDVMQASAAEEAKAEDQQAAPAEETQSEQRSLGRAVFETTGKVLSGIAVVGGLVFGNPDWRDNQLDSETEKTFEEVDESLYESLEARDKQTENAEEGVNANLADANRSSQTRSGEDLLAQQTASEPTLAAGERDTFKEGLMSTTALTSPETVYQQADKSALQQYQSDFGSGIAHGLSPSESRESADRNLFERATGEKYDGDKNSLHQSVSDAVKSAYGPEAEQKYEQVSGGQSQSQSEQLSQQQHVEHQMSV